MTLQDLIEARGISREDLAAGAFVSRATVWRWCNGLTYPQHAQATSVAVTLGVSVAELFKAVDASQKKARQAATA